MEKRKYTRFRAQGNAYAALRDHTSKVGKIYDISMNGLGFRYLADQKLEEKFTCVDIFLSDGEFLMFQVPCDIVYDLTEENSGTTRVSPYRCGLQFKPLNEEQQDKLEYFLDNCTAGECELKS